MSKYLGGIIYCRDKIFIILNGFPGGGSIKTTVYYRGETHRSLYYNLKIKNKEHYESRCTIYMLTPEFRTTVISS